MKNKLSYILIAFTLILSACSSLPELTNYPSTKIITGYGPEDMVVDSISGNIDRLLISCSARREDDPDSLNGIYAMDLNNEKAYELIRENEADSLSFHPHGIDMAFIDGQAYLFVINHNDEKGIQSILRYQVFADKLVFDSLINDELIISPNDIFANNDGSFFFSNDAGVRGSKKEIIFGQKKGSLVFFPAQASPYIIDNHLGYPNGVYFDGEYLYVSTVTEENLYRYKKTDNGFGEKTLLAEHLKGGDNINPYKGGLLIPTHPKFFKFIRHSKKSKCKSPSVVYYYHPDFEKAQVIYCDYGDHINTVSTALIYGNKLYVSQIFDNFILSNTYQDKQK